MIIKQSQVTLHSEHQRTESRTVLLQSSQLINSGEISAERAEAFQAWLEQLQQPDTGSALLMRQGEQQQELSLIEQLNRGWLEMGPGGQLRQRTDTTQSTGDDLLAEAREARRKLLGSLMDALFSRVGRKSSLTAQTGVSSGAMPSGTLVADRQGVLASPAPSQQTEELTAIPLRPLKLTVNVTAQEVVEEYECSRFNACGVIRTADGREIDMNLQVSMERSYKETRSFSETREITFIDPLVLHFGGHSTELSEEAYSFDLDMDGQQDQLRFIEASSAFLALDRNNDGVINDGSELFGAKSGNGFADLAQHDDDGNGYIDEADAIFNELKLWSKATDGSDILESLSERGVGAIYLGASETPFEIKDAQNNTQARVRASGFFLKESGEVGTVQQLDMATETA